MAADDFVDEEFWWMPLLGLPTQGRVGVAVSRWTPPDEHSLFEPIHGHSTIENLGIWAGEQRWENLHRTLEVVVDEGNPKSIFGPIVIDLDADEESFDRLGRPSNDLLQLAKDLTFNVVQHLGAAGVSNSHRRVYFIGPQRISCPLRTTQPFRFAQHETSAK